MIEFFMWYLSVGCAFYLIFLTKDAVRGFSSFKKATVMDIVRGAGIPFVWPYLLWHMQWES